MIIFKFLGQYSAEIIALCALVFTGYATYSTRKHNRLSVKPHLTTFINRNQKPTEGELSILLLNNGLGPAVITKFKLFLDRKPLDVGSAKEAEMPIRNVLGEINFNHSTTVLAKQYSMPASDQKEILKVNFEVKNDSDFGEVEEKLNRFDLVVNYESMYGEAFSLDTRKMPANKRMQSDAAEPYR